MHDEEMIKNHIEQLNNLKITTEKQTEELQKGRQEFSNLRSDIRKLKDELIEKKTLNGNRYASQDAEMKTLRQMMIETCKNVEYLRGVKDGELKAEKKKLEAKKEEREEGSSRRDTAKTFLAFVVSPVTLAVLILKEFNFI